MGVVVDRHEHHTLNLLCVGPWQRSLALLLVNVPRHAATHTVIAHVQTHHDRLLGHQSLDERHVLIQVIVQKSPQGRNTQDGGFRRRTHSRSHTISV